MRLFILAPGTFLVFWILEGHQLRNELVVKKTLKADLMKTNFSTEFIILRSLIKVVSSFKKLIN